MAYTKARADWADGAAGATPITSDNLDTIETGIYDAHVTADAAVPKSTVTTAGDLIYGTASATVARLAIGTARQVLATNSGATAPEWVASLQSLLTATGDIPYASAANTPARLAVGSNDDVLTLAAGVPSWAAPAAVSLTTASGDVSGDVTMTNANTYYDGPSVSLAAGTWLIVGTVLVYDSDEAVICTAKLWDGTTPNSSTEGRQISGQPLPLSVAGIVAPGSTTTYKISVASTGAGSLIKAAAVNNGAGNNASHIRAIKVV